MGTGQGNAAPPGAGGATREDRAMIHLFHKIAGLTRKVDGASLKVYVIHVWHEGRWSEAMEKLRLWRDDWRVFSQKDGSQNRPANRPKMTYVIHVYHGRFPGTIVRPSVLKYGETRAIHVVNR